MAYEFTFDSMRQAVRDLTVVYRGKLGEQLTKLELGGWGNHPSSQQNPHGDHKDKMGLDKIEDYPIATEGEAQAGVQDDRYLIVSLLTQGVQETPVPPPVIRSPMKGIVDQASGTVKASEFTVFPYATNAGAFSQREHRFQRVESSSLVTVETITATHTDEIPIPGNLDSGVYFWQCRDSDDQGHVSAWSWPETIEVA